MTYQKNMKTIPNFEKSLSRKIPMGWTPDSHFHRTRIRCWPRNAFACGNEAPSLRSLISCTWGRPPSIHYSIEEEVWSCLQRATRIHLICRRNLRPLRHTWRSLETMDSDRCVVCSGIHRPPIVALLSSPSWGSLLWRHRLARWAAANQRRWGTARLSSTPQRHLCTRLPAATSVHTR